MACPIRDYMLDSGDTIPQSGREGYMGKMGHERVRLYLVSLTERPDTTTQEPEYLDDR